MEYEPGASDDYLPMDPKRLLQRLHTALNSYDLENLLRCYQPDYEHYEPALGGQLFIGSSRLEDNWREFFSEVTGLHADLLNYTFETDTIWSEWHWTGKHKDGRSLDKVGVILYGVEEGLIAWSREYMFDVVSSGKK